MSIPTHVTTQQILDACAALGLDPRDVAELTIHPNAVALTIYVRDAEGRILLDTTREAPALDRLTIPRCPPCSGELDGVLDPDHQHRA